MKKLDKVIESSHEIKETIAVHNEKLDHGDARMTKIENDVDLVRTRLHETNQVVMTIKEKVKRL